MTDFNSFGFSPALIRAIAQAGFTTPTPVQVLAIPPQMQGRDLIGLAQTGTGKTAAFALPLIEALGGRQGRRLPGTPAALILAPTRELAVQIEAELNRFGKALSLRCALILGGMPRGKQIRQLASGVDVVVATPGRLVDLMGEGKVTLGKLSLLVLDEADRMLDMGFIRDIRRIVATTPETRRTALFSATMAPEVEKLAAELLRDPAKVEVAPQGTAAGTIEQRLERVPAGGKRQRLAALLADPEMARVIVFARTKRGADRVAENLVKDGIPADAIHGNKAQNARQRALDAFRQGRARVLVATDIAARGIDVTGVTHVVNHDLPDEPESYTHRIGRTGRNGADGVAITLCDEGETDKLAAVEKVIRQSFQPDGTLGDYVPRHAPQQAARKPGNRNRRRPRRAA